jgi:hypothetical protein
MFQKRRQRDTEMFEDTDNESSLTPTMQSPRYFFYPIPGRQEMNHQHREVTNSSCQDSEFSYHDCENNVDLTPYPYEPTNEEMEDWDHLLKDSFGENWSLHLAAELSSCEMSIDGHCSDDDCSEFSEFDEDDQSSSEHPAAGISTEDPKISAMRNLLWKQSLKPSIFAKSKTSSG